MNNPSLPCEERSAKLNCVSPCDEAISSVAIQRLLRQRTSRNDGNRDFSGLKSATIVGLRNFKINKREVYER
jgi:hypothetical protein